MSCCAWFFYNKIDVHECDDIGDKHVISNNKTCREKENVLEIPIRYIKGIASKITNIYRRY